MLEKARQSAQQIADAPITEEVEEELKQMRANAAAERIAAFATAYNNGQGMPQPVQTLQPAKPAQTPVQQAAQGQVQQEQAGQTPPAQPESVQTAQATEHPAPAGSTPTSQQQADAITAVTVTVNGEKLTLTGKKDYIYVDVFDHIDFDLSKPKGKTVETLINGRRAQYVEPLKTGDVLDIFWKD